ncbi:MAG: helix-turn-helix domain-containing protein [Neomegalonema sp.]|nr:helix-turn-helix domain-containing protein [Neomegalonema sp.]
MGPTSALLSPPRDLFGCVFAAIVRDTRALELSDFDRFNFFPASPLTSVTFVAEGELRLAPIGCGVEAARTAPALQRLFTTPPQDAPTVSWSAGPVFAITVGVFPDAWLRLTSSFDIARTLMRAFERCDDIDTCWSRFCASASDAWRAARADAALPNWTGLPQLSDWSRALVARAALAGPGRSARAFERRLRRWSGQTRRSLAFFAAFEELHRLSVQAKRTSPAELALDAGYSDQSHMGRAVRRATGFSPARLNRLIETEEAFWCYRLLGERF